MSAHYTPLVPIWQVNSPLAALLSDAEVSGRHDLVGYPRWASDLPAPAPLPWHVRHPLYAALVGGSLALLVVWALSSVAS